MTATVAMIALRRARIDYGISIELLAAMSGVSMSTISRIENAYRGHQTTHEVASALSHALGVQVEEIDWPNGLSDRPKPPGTAAGYARQENRSNRLCQGCFVELPNTGLCDSCT